MPRNLTAEYIAELSSPVVYPVLLAELHFISATEYVWTGYGVINWNGHDWKGVGEMGSISEMAESTDIYMNGCTLTLTGIPYIDPSTGTQIDPVNQAFTECAHGRSVKIYKGYLNNASGVFIPDPALHFSGNMDVVSIEEGENTCTVALNVEPRRIDISRNRERRYTDQDQKANYASDVGFEYVALLQEWDGVAGKNSNGTGSPNIPPWKLPDGFEKG